MSKAPHPNAQDLNFLIDWAIDLIERAAPHVKRLSQEDTLSVGKKAIILESKAVMLLAHVKKREQTHATNHKTAVS